MRRFFFCLFACFSLFAGLLAAQGNEDWHRAFPPHKIAGNLYYVGTADLAVYLIATPAGNILINTDFEEDVPTIQKSVEQLGFKFSDIKIILLSHAHADHDGGTALVKKLTGAKLAEMEADVPATKAKVDRVLHDGDVVELGGSKLTAHLTPGHTKGCTTWTVPVQDGGRMLNAVIIGSPNVNPGYILVRNEKYPEIAQDYEKTFRVLKSLPCDLFLGAHGAYYGMKEKYAKLSAGGANPFIDPEGYKAYVAERESAFRKELARQQGK
jgi:metallo-beta-lactamase class B